LRRATGSANRGHLIDKYGRFVPVDAEKRLLSQEQYEERKALALERKQHKQELERKQREKIEVMKRETRGMTEWQKLYRDQWFARCAGRFDEKRKLEEGSCREHVG